MPLWGWAALAALNVLALASGMFAVRERRRSRAAEQDALRDPLTGVGNRLAFDHHLAIAWERAKRYDEGLGVLVLDLDNFKQVNDAEGHLAGDKVLREVGNVIASRSRRSDAPARLGGDEFAVLASGPGVSGLATLAEGLRASLKEKGISVSLGFATRRPRDGDSTMVLHRADLAMYEDKAARRKGETVEGPVPSARAGSSNVNVAAG
jgi:diguanylate cyclase (GGDEF)-like protein